MDSVVYVLLFCQDSGQRYEIRNDGHNVDDVHHIFKKVSLVWTTYDAYDDLESKPHYANCFDEKKWVCKVGHFILLDSRQIVSAVEKFIVSELRQRFKAKYDDRKENDHYWDDGYNTGSLRTFRVLEKQPHFPFPLDFR